MDATALLRPHLLDGRVVVLGGGGDALGSPLAALGAVTPLLEATLEEDAVAARVQQLLAQHGALDMLLHDLRPAFATGGDDALRATLDTAWIVARAVATAAFIPSARGGRIAVVAPPPHGGEPSAEGVRAAAENLARTLSIEWARHGIRTVAITPGAATTDDEIAALAGYLASPAGDYCSGCRMALGKLALA